jgi:2-furoyl-CoA dehydrogenase large subunit
MQDVTADARRWVGTPITRKEDAALLTGRGRFIDDLSPVAGMKHAALLRSPHAHAQILGIDVTRARALPGVSGVLIGTDLAPLIGPMPSVVKAAPPYLPIAVDRARYVGEPVAVVVAESRYVAEDACELIGVDYAPLPAASDLRTARSQGAPILHAGVGSNIVSRRSFRYGDPDRAFAQADRVFEFSYEYPRCASTPMETIGVIANFEPAPDRFTIWSNFQGPFVLHPLMAGSLRVPGPHLRLITPPCSGGSFGIKQAAASYIVLMAAVSRRLGWPVKWIEDRAEHLTAASASSERIGSVAAAFTGDGVLTALRFFNVASMGAYVRAPEPASLYRMHSASSSCYRVPNIAIDNELVVTNRTPVGLNRGYGGPQFYFALERVMEIAARGLGLDAAALRRQNFLPQDAFPYCAPAGAVLDAGNYHAALDELLRLADYQNLRRCRAVAREQGRLFGIGLAAGIEPSGSNMAYVSLAQTPQERALSAEKSGAHASAVTSIDPTGRVVLRLCSTPNGQGHATVAAQIVADELGLRPEDIDVVTEMDTLTSAWSLASGNYSNRFAAIVVDAVAKSARQVAGRLKRIAAKALECGEEAIELVDGFARVAGGSNKGIQLRKLASQAHWHPAGLPADSPPGIYETATVSPAELGAAQEDDRICSAATFAFAIDLAAIEVDRSTGKVRIEKYVSVHDVGKQLHPRIVEGQIHGGFAHGLGAALMEELAYDEQGQFLSGTFADYLCPTAVEMPELTIGHCTTPSPRNALGAKGTGDGSSMLAPAAIANAVADALGREDIDLPLTPPRLWALANGRSPRRSMRHVASQPGQPAKPAPSLLGEGEVVLSASPEEVWRRLIDPAELAAIVPGCRRLVQEAPDCYRADLALGIAGMKGAYAASIEVRDKDEPRTLRLLGNISGALGFASGEGLVRLSADEGSTRLAYRYSLNVGGKVASVGQRMLATVMRALIGEFFRGLQRRVSRSPRGWPHWLSSKRFLKRGKR